MSAEQQLADILRQLPPAKHEEVLNFAQFLRSKGPAAPQPRTSAEGLWADLGVSLSAEDIDEARREAWGNSPREDV
jgi:hypothetical protein